MRSTTGCSASVLTTGSSDPVTVRRSVVASLPSATHAGDAGDALEGRRRDRFGEHDLDLAHGLAHELGDVLHGDELALAHEGDAVAHALHLRQHVRGEEHGLAGVADLVQQVVELVLDERVEARGGLVQDQQLGPVHERLDEADLAPVAGGEIGHLALEVAVQALRQRGDVVPVDAAAQVGEVAQRLAPGEVGVQAQLTGQVAAARLDRQRLAAAVPAEDEGAPGRRPDQVQQHADGGRLAGAVGAEEAEHLARPDLQVEVDDAAAAPPAVALGQPLGDDGRRGGAAAHPDSSPSSSATRALNQSSVAGTTSTGVCVKSKNSRTSTSSMGSSPKSRSTITSYMPKLMRPSISSQPNPSTKMLRHWRR